MCVFTSQSLITNCSDKTLIHTVRWTMTVKRDVLKSSSLKTGPLVTLVKSIPNKNKWPSCYHSGTSHKSLNTAVQETKNHAHKIYKHFFLMHICRNTALYKHSQGCWFVMIPINFCRTSDLSCSIGLKY